MRKFRALISVTVLFLLCTGLSAASALPEVLEQFDAVQNSMRTMSARLKVTTHNRLLREPEINEGYFYMTKPNSLRWEFETPEQMRFVIADDFYTGYFPKQKKAEQKNIKRWSDHLFRYFGLGQGSEELSKFYIISLAPENDSERSTVELILMPKKRRAKKRVDSVRFLVDRESMLPVRVEYLSKRGDRRIVEFFDVDLNGEIATSTYKVDIPAGVEISKGFTAFGGG